MRLLRRKDLTQVGQEVVRERAVAASETTISSPYGGVALEAPEDTMMEVLARVGPDGAIVYECLANDAATIATTRPATPAREEK